MNKLKTLTVSIIIPGYNEKFTIEKIIRKINSIKHKFNYEVIVVDDFSTDGTRNILKKLQKTEVLWSGGYGEGRTPDSIPNSVVKTFSADGTLS